eukprot:Plantae.Rhodophyta-Hildenbrandia_rubra.ctg26636.p1 GENE.Plantae.Rhodophyta-Hildenbrandia_rubra.ctg26636~~Plantae.Rhodophyta-Hildenbrandia_rubra.ctg26636.p1  ORF type:complete len:343 (+),score=46.23 Plantae.Rhodophyta-Hildenbrandia_rubra.ctg26636:382-1410(+)
MPVKARRTLARSRRRSTRWIILIATALPFLYAVSRILKGRKPLSHLARDVPSFSTVLKVHDDIEMFWAIPDGDSSKAEGVVFLAHGCGHSAVDWAGGLPVERRIVEQVVNRNLIAFATSATGRSGCWRVEDVPRIRNGLEHLFLKLGGNLRELPLFAIGCSSGGSLAALLPKYIPLQGVAIIAAPSKSNVFTDKLAAGQKSYPATAFIYFKRDRRIVVNVKKNVHVLQKLKIPTTQFGVLPKQMTTSFFSDNIPSMSQEISSQIHAAFLRHTIIDPSGWLKQDPRSSNWRGSLSELRYLLNDTLRPNKSPISELMNVAWGKHELTAEYTPQILAFFMKHAPG